MTDGEWLEEAKTPRVLIHYAMGDVAWPLKVRAEKTKIQDKAVL